MIPPIIGKDTRSPGERELFIRLRDEPGTADWIVLHSFDLPKHTTQVRGEADFVILAPGLGMLCLEVKAHRRVARDTEGRWRMGSDPATSRSPFKQANDNMHSLLGVLRARRKREADAVIAWSAVLFTHCNFQEPATEWNEWEALDKGDFHGRPVAALLGGVLVQARKQLPNKAREGVPTAEQCESIASALRPRFEVVQPASGRRAEQETMLREFTEEQFGALDGMSWSPRTVFEGPAGTGKTLLALEAARRSVATGRRTGILCFNRHLGDWLEREVAGSDGLITATTIHQLMLRAAGLSKPPEGANSEFFTMELPELATEAVLDREAPAMFEALVVDEAQDILRASYLDFLDVICEGGIAAGRWTFFGDFERQALFDAADIPLDDFLAGRGGVGRFGLRTNCRNTPRVAGWVTMLAGLDPPYARIRRPDEGLPPRTKYYRSDGDQLAELVKLLDELYAAGYEGQDIVLLSFKRDGAGSRLSTAPWRDRVKPYGASKPPGGHVRYATVQAFKGLEAPVVIVTDVDEIQGDRAQALFYTATTRPTERLYVLADEVLADQMFDLLDRFQPEGQANGA